MGLLSIGTARRSLSEHKRCRFYRRLLLAADTGGALLGMASAQTLVSTADGGPAVLMEDVGVAEAWRGRGIGRMPAGALKERATRRRAARLKLLADRDNEPALRFYAAIDWQRTRLICLRKQRVGQDPLS